MLDLVILAIATYYTQYVLRWESGPFGVFDLIREKVFGVKVDIGSSGELEFLPIRPGTLADLVQCVYCSSIWVALVITSLWFGEFLVTYSLAVAGGAVVISRIVERWQ